MSERVTKYDPSHNLIPWKPGQSGNPAGRIKTAKFRKMLTNIMLQQHDAEINGVAMHGTRLRNMIIAIYDKAMGLMPDVTSMDELMEIMDFLRFTADMMDGKTQPNPATVKETKEQHTVMLSPTGGVLRSETLLTASETATEQPLEEPDEE